VSRVIGTFGVQLTESDDPIPVGELVVVPILRRQRSPIRVGDDPRPGAREDDRAEGVVRVMMREHEIPDRRIGDRPDRRQQTPPLIRAPLGIDHDHAAVSDDKAGVGTPFRAATRVAGDDVDAISDAGDRIRRRGRRAEEGESEGER
jgi:hypothetical protein